MFNIFKSVSFANIQSLTRDDFHHLHFIVFRTFTGVLNIMEDFTTNAFVYKS